MEREGGGVGGGRGGGTTPLFFFFFQCTRPVASTPPCYIIHSSTSAWSRWRRRRFFFWGGSPTGRSRTRAANRCLVVSVVIFCIKTWMFLKEVREKKGERVGVFMWQVSPPSASN